MKNVFNLIEKVRTQKNKTKADIARKLGISHSSVSGMFERGTIQLKRVVDISHALKYNFLREIASTIDYKEPEMTKGNEHLQEVKQLKEEIKRLQIKVEVLQETLEKAIRK